MDADIPPPSTSDAAPQPEAGPPTGGTMAPPEMDAAAMDAQVETDAATPMDAASDADPPDADPPDADPPDADPPDADPPDAMPDATVCPDPLPCVCAQHAPLHPPSDGCVRPICPEQGCSPDSDCTFLYDRTSAYYFCKNDRTWSEAEDHCELSDMTLVSIDDEQEDDLVYDNIEAKTWLGGRDGDGPEEGTWRWPDGRVFFVADNDRPGPPPPPPPPATYLNWHASEPNDQGLSPASPADCMLFWFENGVWADGSCDAEHGYVCEVARE
jgi:hypothetical protein